MKELTFDKYQSQALKTAVFPQKQALPYLALGLTGEAGEVAEKIKKVIRDKNGYIDSETRIAIAKEIGDVMWYSAVLLDYIGVYFGDAANMNLDKLASRLERDQLKGSGDDR